MVVALLATLKAGGAYVPLDTGYPAERLAFMLADSSPRALVTDTATRDALGDMPASLSVVALDADRTWQSMPATNPDPSALGLTSSNLAYVIYTSGSTGRPKGVMVEHAGLVNYLHWAVSAYAPMGSVVSSSLSFDATVTSLYLPLVRGTCVTLLPEQGEMDALQAVWTGPGRTGLVKITPAHLEVLGRQLQAQGLPCSAELFVIGGEALPARVVRLWHELAPHVRLVNEYGPTETVVGCVVQELAPDALVPDRVPIGRPIANTRIYILDAHGQPSPVGVTGEIHIAGIQVARGYLRLPDLTAERFVPDPFGEPGSRMYKTGDLGCWRPDGTIAFLGRNDHQVKVRGFRIELGEIEAALRSHPEVRDAVVLAREDGSGNQHLVAYVAGEATPKALRAHLGSRLPEYMVPAAYVTLDALPLTPNGKLDRAALPAPHHAALPTNQYEPPRVGIERVLAKVWSKVLKLALVGREDHFFELGGHSLLAVQLAAQAKRRGLNLTLQDIYAYPTLRAQAERLLGGEHSSDTRALAIRRTGSAPTLFVLPTGMGDVTYAFELAAHLDTDAPAYAIPWPDVIPKSMDALAADMVRIMRVVQPAGPYRLLGYSSGALLTYAMAQLLAEQGEPVDFIGMLDCELHTKDYDDESPEEMARRWLIHELSIMEQALGEQEDARQVLRQLADDLARTPLDEFIAQYEHHDLLGALAGERHFTVRQGVTNYLRMAQFHKLWPSYAARALPAPLKLHVFYATEGTAPPHPMGWQELLPLNQIIVVPVPGTHTSMMEPPHIGHVGRAVSEALRQSRPATDSSAVQSSQ
jgi:amino acid adenylation domain-containing protein